MKKLTSIFLVLLLFASFASPVFADATKVVTLGADLTDEQKQTMWDYFGTTSDQVVTVEVNNQEEHAYLDGIAPQEQIGSVTYSCAYVEPTQSGGITVKTANLNWVTADMISSALSTAGIENANVVAASPLPVSGTGALTGILKSFQQVAGEEISEEKQDAANQELITTADIATEYTDQGMTTTDAQNQASEVVNEAKKELLEEKQNGEVTEDQIQAIVDGIGTNLTDTQKTQLYNLLTKINQIDYSSSEITAALNNINKTLDKLVNGVTENSGFFAGIIQSIKNLFGGSSITDQTNDAVLGAGAVITDTASKLEDTVATVQKSSWWDKLVSWFENLFKSDKNETETTTTEESAETFVPETEETTTVIAPDETVTQAEESVQEEQTPQTETAEETAVSETEASN